MAVLYYLGMKTILFVLMVLVAFATAEEFKFDVELPEDKCRNFTYDTYTHEFKPADCHLNIACDVQMKGLPVVTVIRSVGKEPKIYMRTRTELRDLSTAEFSMLLSNGAISVCKSNVYWGVDKSK